MAGINNTLRICILMLDVKESANEDSDAAMTEILNELLQEKLPDADIDWSHRIRKLKNCNQSSLSSSRLPDITLETESSKTKKVQRHYYQHNQEPHSKANANANQSKKWVLTQKCLDKGWKHFSKIRW